MKGLLDVPICSVEDQAAPRYLLSPPSGQDFRQGGFMPKGNTRYSANISKMIPAIGVGEFAGYHYESSGKGRLWGRG